MKTYKNPLPYLVAVLGVILASAFLTGAPSASAAADSDGDGLPNRWENGSTLVQGHDISAPPYNADPRHKDIFLEIDYTQANFKTKLPCISLNKFVKMFANAPLTNPDGVNGITLHIDADRRCGNNDYDFGGSQAGTPHHPAVLASERGNPCDQIFKEGFDDGDVAQMPAWKKRVFHHALFVGKAVPSDDLECGGLLGIARGVPSRQLVVAVTEHAGFGPEREIPEVLGTLIHEFGHLLSLTHTGVNQNQETLVNHNPYSANHLSLMNYFHAGGIWTNATDERSTYDFQRYPIAALNELTLNEAQGLNGPNENWIRRFQVAYLCDSVLFELGLDGPANANVDWDCDGNESEALVTRDIDTTPGFNEHIATINEWLSIDFGGGAGGQIGAREGFDESDSRPLPPSLEFTIGDRLAISEALEERARQAD